MGKSGSGKSTLLQIISGLDLPSQGRVMLSGRDLSQLSKRDLSEMRGSEMGFVFQSFNLVPALTVLENVELPLLFQGTRASERKSRANELLERVGLSHRLNQRSVNLSGGEKQRVAIARALAADPKVILADEPTGNLDESSSEAIYQLLVEINEQGKTVLLATHDQIAASKADRIVNLTNGRIADEAVSR